MLTPYQFASNTPIQAIDLDGLERMHFVVYWINQSEGKPQMVIQHLKTETSRNVSVPSALSFLGHWADLTFTIPYEREFVFWTINKNGVINNDGFKFNNFKDACKAAENNFEGINSLDYRKSVAGEGVFFNNIQKLGEFTDNLGAVMMLASSIKLEQTQRVGQWMSKSEYENFIKTGEIPRSNVLTKGKEGYIKQANAGDYYTEFDIDKTLLEDKNSELGWSLIKSKNQLRLKFSKIKGETLPAAKGTNIKHVDTKN